MDCNEGEDASRVIQTDAGLKLHLKRLDNSELSKLEFYITKPKPIEIPNLKLNPGDTVYVAQTFSSKKKAEILQKRIPKNGQNKKTTPKSKQTKSQYPELSKDEEKYIREQTKAEIPTTKRKREEQQLRKILGLDFMSRSGTHYRAKAIQGACTCSSKCSTLIRSEEQQAIFKHYYALNQYNKDRYLMQCIKTFLPSVRRNYAGIKQQTNEYRFVINGKLIKVCKLFFCNTLDVTLKFINEFVHKNMKPESPDSRFYLLESANGLCTNKSASLDDALYEPFDDIDVCEDSRSIQLHRDQSCVQPSVQPYTEQPINDTVQPYIEQNVSKIQTVNDTVQPYTEQPINDTVQPYIEQNVSKIQTVSDTVQPYNEQPINDTVQPYIEQNVSKIQTVNDTVQPYNEQPINDTVQPYIEQNVSKTQPINDTVQPYLHNEQPASKIQPNDTVQPYIEQPASKIQPINDTVQPYLHTEQPESLPSIDLMQPYMQIEQHYIQNDQSLPHVLNEKSEQYEALPSIGSIQPYIEQPSYMQLDNPQIDLVQPCVQREQPYFSLPNQSHFNEQPLFEDEVSLRMEQYFSELSSRQPRLPNQVQPVQYSLLEMLTDEYDLRSDDDGKSFTELQNKQPLHNNQFEQSIEQPYSPLLPIRTMFDMDCDYIDDEQFLYSLQSEQLTYEQPTNKIITFEQPDDEGELVFFDLQPRQPQDIEQPMTNSALFQPFEQLQLTPTNTEQSNIEYTSIEQPSVLEQLNTTQITNIECTVENCIPKTPEQPTIIENLDNNFEISEMKAKHIRDNTYARLPKTPDARQVQALRKLLGLSHVLASGKFIPAKRVRGSCTCSKRCYAKICREDQENIFRRFYSLTQDGKDRFIGESVKVFKAKQVRALRQHTHEYSFKVNGSNVNICKHFLTQTLDVTKRYIADTLKRFHSGPKERTVKKKLGKNRNKYVLYRVTNTQGLHDLSNSSYDSLDSNYEISSVSETLPELQVEHLQVLPQVDRPELEDSLPELQVEHLQVLPQVDRPELEDSLPVLSVDQILPELNPPEVLTELQDERTELQDERRLVHRIEVDQPNIAALPVANNIQPELQVRERFPEFQIPHLNEIKVNASQPTIQAIEPTIQAIEPEIQAVEPEIQAGEPEIQVEMSEILHKIQEDPLPELQLDQLELLNELQANPDELFPHSVAPMEIEQPEILTEMLLEPNRTLDELDTSPEQPVVVEQPNSQQPTATIKRNISKETERYIIENTTAEFPTTKPKRAEQFLRKMLGLKYTAENGVTYPPKTVRGTCHCERKCYERITGNQQRSIFSDYYHLNQNGKDAFIYRCIKTNKPYHYVFTIDGKKIKTCRAFVLKTLDITDKYLDNVTRKYLKTENNKQYSNHKLNILADIQSYPTYYYNNKTYVHPSLTLLIMYNNYKDKCIQNNIKYKNLSSYRKMFKKEKLYFTKKWLNCKMCDKLKNLISKPELVNKYKPKLQMHTNLINLLLNKRNYDYRQVIKNNGKLIVKTLGVQRVLNAPNYDDASKRKLHVFNVTSFDLLQNEYVNYMWHEGHGNRGTDELITVLMKDLLGVPNTCEHVIIYTNNLQFKTIELGLMLIMCLSLKTTIKLIEVKFIHPGHSKLECDVLHSQIDNAQQTVKIPADWYDLIKNLPAQKPIKVTEMNFNDFYDFKYLCTNVPQVCDINWSQIINISVDRSDLKVIKLYEGNNTCQYIDVEDVNLVLKRKYKEQVGISTDKYKDLLSYDQHCQFYKGLPHSNDVLDVHPDIASDLE